MAAEVHVRGHVVQKSGYWQYQVTCMGCDWVGDTMSTSNEAAEDYRRHRRLLAGQKGIFECGCEPGDDHPRAGYASGGYDRVIGRTKLCPVHRQAYIPKQPPKPTAKPAVSTEQILEALRAKHMDVTFKFQRPWYFTTELRLDTGFAGDTRRGGQKVQVKQLHDGKGQPAVDELGRPKMYRVHPNATRLDAFAMHMWRSKDFERVAYEVKVSRSDFLNEIRKPWKREPGMAVSNRFFYVTPPGLITKGEVPAGCGLMEVSPSGHVRTVVKAPLRNEGQDALSTGFIVSIIRRTMRESEA